MSTPASSYWLSLNPRHILIRMPNWLGDAVMATPILTDLRHRWPEAKITALCQNPIGQLLIADPHVDQILDFKRPSGWIHRIHPVDILQPLQQGHYDLGILLTNSLSSAWLFWKGNVQNRVGYDTHWRRYLLDLPVSLPFRLNEQHLVTTYKMLLEPLGIPISNTNPTLYITAEEEQIAIDRLAKYGFSNKRHLFIGINPGAAYGSAKCWLPERFKEITYRLLNHPNVVVLYFGDKAGESLVCDICHHMPERVINLAGKTSLRELIAFIKHCHLFLTNDSGPMHIASALNVPLLALFGSTSDSTTGPYRGGKVIHKHVPCSPCYRRECPIDFRCMKQIEVNEVYQELSALLNSFL
jgi:heptosyltransferase-2